jgi:hypothetical protein
LANFQKVAQDTTTQFDSKGGILTLIPNETVSIDLYGGGPNDRKLVVDLNDISVASVSSEPIAFNQKSWLSTYSLKALKPGNAMLEARLFDKDPTSYALRRESWFSMPVWAYIQVVVKPLGAITIKDGQILDGRVKLNLFANLEHGDLSKVNALVLHQTDSNNAKGTLEGYKSTTIGAHFLIDKDGTIYQTARLNKKCFHVGLLQARCYNADNCSPEEQAAIKTIQGIKGAKNRIVALNKHESGKEYPNRYPGNSDSIGIEVVGKATGKAGKEVYEDPTPAQDSSVKWLVAELLTVFRLQISDVYRHPTLSYKNPTEAQHVTW